VVGASTAYTTLPQKINVATYCNSKYIFNIFSNFTEYSPNNYYFNMVPIPVFIENAQSFNSSPIEPRGGSCSASDNSDMSGKVDGGGSDPNGSGGNIFIFQ
jgi:hypothetical protein